MDDLNKALQEIARLREENSNLKQHLGLAVAEPPVTYVTKSGELPLQAPALPTVHSDSPSKEKITLFRTLFRGREDVYAVQVLKITSRPLAKIRFLDGQQLYVGRRGVKNYRVSLQGDALIKRALQIRD